MTIILCFFYITAKIALFIRSKVDFSSEK